MKLYQINWTSQDEKEWVASISLIGAIKFYCLETDFDISDFEDDDEIIEISESEWDKLIVKNLDYDETDPDDEEQWTVRELMNRSKQPRLIAGTMYE